MLNIQSYLGLPASRSAHIRASEHQVRLALLEQLVKEHGHAIWIKFGYVVEPVRIPIYRAENAGSAHNLTEAYREGRNIVTKMMIEPLKKDGILAARQESPLLFSNNLRLTERKSAEEQALVTGFYQPGDIVLEGYTINKGRKLIREKLDCLVSPKKCPGDEPPTANDAATCGVYPSDPSSQAACLMDVKEEAIFNTLLVNEVAITPPSSGYTKNLAEAGKRRIRRVSLALPTTSKGLKDGEEPVFMQHLIPSVIKTVTPAEFESVLLTVYIGYDHGDLMFADASSRDGIIRQLMQVIGDLPIQVKLIELPNVQRVALLWNLLYLHALREGTEYYYYVNDDLRMVTSGWLTYFTETLDKTNGFGVVGPADFHNKLNCTILTQAMVTPVHFEIFGMLYPVELKDWKCDRWLTYVYQPDDTHCRQDVVANNGGAPTRYTHCELLSYVIYLEAGKRRIAEWKEKQADKNDAKANPDADHLPTGPEDEAIPVIDSKMLAGLIGNERVAE